MSAEEAQVPGPPTWREYLDARLEPLATKEFVREKIDRATRWVIGSVITVGGILAALILSQP